MSVFAVAMAVLLAVVIAPLAAVTYLLGAVLSAGAGYAGMTVATMANARTTEAAKAGPGQGAAGRVPRRRRDGLLASPVWRCSA